VPLPDRVRNCLCIIFLWWDLCVGAECRSLDMFIFFSWGLIHSKTRESHTRVSVQVIGVIPPGMFLLTNLRRIFYYGVTSKVPTDRPRGVRDILPFFLHGNRVDSLPFRACSRHFFTGPIQISEFSPEKNVFFAIFVNVFPFPPSYGSESYPPLWA